MRRWGDLIGLLVWGMVTAFLTLTPGPVNSEVLALGPSCFVCGELGGADMVRNILLFAPGGVFLVRLGYSATVVLGVAVLLSGAIELTQWLVVVGRHASIRDLAINGAGAYVGGLSYLAVASGLRRASRTFALAMATGAVCGVALTGWLMQPSTPAGIYSAHWVPVRTFYAPWTGEVLSASVDTIPTPDGPLSQTSAVRRALDVGAPVTVAFRLGAPPPKLAAIYRLEDEAEREILMAGVVGADLIVQSRNRGRDARLGIIKHRFVGYFDRDAIDDTVHLSVATDAHGRSCVRRGEETVCGSAPSIGAGWRFIVWGVPSWLQRALDGATVVLLLLPLAGAARRFQRPESFGWVLGSFVALAVVGQPFGLAWPGVAEWLGMAGALTVGLVRLRQ